MNARDIIGAPLSIDTSPRNLVPALLAGGTLQTYQNYKDGRPVAFPLAAAVVQNAILASAIGFAAHKLGASDGKAAAIGLGGAIAIDVAVIALKR